MPSSVQNRTHTDAYSVKPLIRTWELDRMVSKAGRVTGVRDQHSDTVGRWPPEPPPFEQLPPKTALDGIDAISARGGPLLPWLMAHHERVETLIGAGLENRNVAAPVEIC